MRVIGEPVDMKKIKRGSDRSAITEWLASYCDQIQHRVQTSQGKFRSVALCELTTARAILRAIETGADVPAAATQAPQRQSAARY